VTLLAHVDLEPKWNEECDFVERVPRHVEGGRRNPDHRVCAVIEPNLLSDHTAIRAKLVSPERVAQHDHRRPTWLFLLLREATTEDRGGAYDLEEVRCNAQPKHRASIRSTQVVLRILVSR
jgi:hypothetical protein